MNDIEIAIDVYTLHNGKRPTSLDELIQFASNHMVSGKPLLKKEDLIDPWGEPFGYEGGRTQFVLVSSGPDRKMGTEDDVFLSTSDAYENSWKARHAQAIAEQETNAVQEATSETVETVQPSVGVEKTQTNRVPVTATQPQKNEPAETKSTPWKIALLLGVFIFGCVVAWRCFRKKKRI